jgi:hypothetical protein
MIVGIILLILIVLVLIFYAGPQIFSPGTSPRSFLDVLAIALAASMVGGAGHVLAPPRHA